MPTILLIHIIFLGLWGGLVLVEILFEVQMFRSQIDERAIARLHQLSDRLIELPVLTVIVASGWYLWYSTNYSSEYIPKIIFALGAVAANMICYIFVEQRASVSKLIQESNDSKENNDYKLRLRNLSKKLLATIIPGIVFAMAALFIAVTN